MSSFEYEKISVFSYGITSIKHKTFISQEMLRKLQWCHLLWKGASKQHHLKCIKVYPCYVGKDVADRRG